MYNDYPLGMTEFDAIAYAADSYETLIDFIVSEMPDVLKSFIQDDMETARAFMAATHPGEGWD